MKKKLKDLLDYEQPTKYIVETENYSDEYKLPVLTAGKSFVLGYTNETEGIFKGKNEPVIIFDDFTRDTKYVDFDFKVKSSAMKILHKHNKDDSLKYLHYALSNIKYVPFSHKRLWISDFSNMEIDYPSPEIQNTIATKLDTIQSAIDNKKQQLALLDEAVKSEFVEMFGENPVESGEWKIERLGDCGTFKNGMNYSPNENGVDILCLNVSDFKDNYKIQDCKTLSSISLNEEPSSEYYLQNDDIVFVRSNGNKKLVGRCVALYPNDCKVLFSGFCIRFRKSTDNLNTDFLLHFLKTDLTREHLKGKGANIQNLNQQILANLHLPVPTLDLQNQFAAFVHQIDKSKFVVKQQIADLQELLDSKMQEYFG